MPRYVVVMIEPEFDESLGHMARAMKNFGLEDLMLVNPTAKIDSRARSRAGHAQEILDKVRAFSSLEDAVEYSDLSVGTTAQRAQSLGRILRRPSTPRGFAEVVREFRELLL